MARSPSRIERAGRAWPPQSAHPAHRWDRFDFPRVAHGFLVQAPLASRAPIGKPRHQGGRGSGGMRQKSVLEPWRKQSTRRRSVHPIGQIDQTVQPTADQRADLDAVKAASAQANESLAASCPGQVPMTPPGRLAAVENRLGAMRQAVETVRKLLEKFYGSLSDEQKARFNAMREESGDRARRAGLMPDRPSQARPTSAARRRPTPRHFPSTRSNRRSIPPKRSVPHWTSCGRPPPRGPTSSRTPAPPKCP